MLLILFAINAYWFQLLLHEASHGIIAEWKDGYLDTKIFPYWHWHNSHLETVYPIWQFYKKPWKIEGITWWWGRHHIPLQIKPENDKGWRHIAPMFAGLGSFILFGGLFFIDIQYTWNTFLPFSIIGLLHVLDFWKDYLVKKEGSDGYRWRTKD